MAQSDNLQNTRRLNLKVIAGIVGVLLICCLALVVQESEPPFRHDADLIKTTLPTSGAMPQMSLGQMMWWKYYELKRRHFPHPMTYTFNALATNRCSIDGLLNQCMEVGGMQYFIEKNVAAGSVTFGQGTALNGRQWLDAFESSLQTNNPEWWDPKQNRFRRENLVLLRYGNRITLVLSKATAQLYERKYPKLRREQSFLPK